MIAFKRLRQMLRQVAWQAVCLLMVTAIAWSSVGASSAIAVSSEKAAAVMNDRAAAELDRVSGAGTSDRLEGAVQGTVGKVKRGVADVTAGADKSLSGRVNTATDKLDGAADELQGKLKRDVGRAKGAAADTADDLEDNAGSIVDSIKDFFD